MGYKFPSPIINQYSIICWLTILISLRAQSSSSLELGVSWVRSVCLPLAETRDAVNCLWSLASHRAGTCGASRVTRDTAGADTQQENPRLLNKTQVAFVQDLSLEVPRPASLKGKTLFHILILCNSLGEFLTISYLGVVGITGSNAVAEKNIGYMENTEINPLFFCNHNYMNCSTKWQCRI